MVEEKFVAVEPGPHLSPLTESIYGPPRVGRSHPPNLEAGQRNEARLDIYDN